VAPVVKPPSIVPAFSIGFLTSETKLSAKQDYPHRQKGGSSALKSSLNHEEHKKPEKPKPPKKWLKQQQPQEVRFE